MHIKEYLDQIATSISEKEIPNHSSNTEQENWRKKQQAKFHRMLGIENYLKMERTPLNIKMTGTLHRDGYRIDKLYFESLPNLYVAANLYVPDHLTELAPAILYLCGHAGKQKIHYQDHPRTLAQLGFITLIIDTIQLGEVFGEHWGAYNRGWFHQYSRGYTPAGVETWNAIRAIDLLCTLENVDHERIGVTGHSGGGIVSWWTTCADDRVKVMASSSGAGTLASHIKDRTIDTHCDCYFPMNPYGWSLTECFALAVPRSVLIVAPDRDLHFKIDSVKEVYDRLKELYKSVNREEHLDYFEFRDYHTYSPQSAQAIFQWFITHLHPRGNRGIEAVDWSDSKHHREMDSDLLVFDNIPPVNDESTSVQDWFVSLAEPPIIGSIEELDRERTRVVQALRMECFFHFPVPSEPTLPTITQTLWDNSGHYKQKFTVNSESDWTLCGELQGSRNHHSQHAPTAVYLGAAEDIGRVEECKEIYEGLERSWLCAKFNVRGTGNTAWGKELQWHLRRSLALTGRTIASMRVWDTLRGLEAIRSMEEVDDSRIVLIGKGELAVIALFAALLDSRIAAVILQDPPATLNIPGTSDGSDHPNEIINALRHTDLTHIAGLLWPTPVIFIGDRPGSYRYAELLHRKLGTPGGTWRLRNFKDIGSLLNNLIR